MNPLRRAALILDAESYQEDSTIARASKPLQTHKVSVDCKKSTRGATTQSHAASPNPPDAKPIVIKPDNEHINDPIRPLPRDLKRTHTALPNDEHTLLLSKQQRLLALDPPDRSNLANALCSTLIFAQESAGTAVCISPHGVLLTCSHCVSESESGPGKDATQWLIFSSGQIVEARCVAFDWRRDLALLQIVAAQTEPAILSKPERSGFPTLSVSPTALRVRQAIVCIGQPGSEDLENPLGGATDYPILSVSEGRFRGLAAEQDVQDNSEIGALQHDCWTYWGHSGAPLVDEKTDSLAGLHSSWDDETGMRKGVAWEAIRRFLGGQGKRIIV